MKPRSYLYFVSNLYNKIVLNYVFFSIVHSMLSEKHVPNCIQIERHLSNRYIIIFFNIKQQDLFYNNNDEVKL